MERIKRLLTPLRSLVALVFTALTPLSVSAHPGHGFGTVGHDAQHALWNFLGMVVVSAVVLVINKIGQKR
jgi:hypothetical protein